MENPIRVLHVLGGLNMGGAESRIMDLYRHIDTSLVQFDFMIHTEEKGVFEEEVNLLGGKIYRIPQFKGYNFLKYKKEWKLFFNKHTEFKAVHGHMTSTASLYLPIAKKSGVPITIAHARSAGVDQGIKGYVTKILRIGLVKKADFCLACSDLAGQAVFGKKYFEVGKVYVIPNAIDAIKYQYNEQVRTYIRSKLDIDNRFVVGHVGRFHYAKNHEFIIEVFEKVHLINKSSILLLVGDGPLLPQIRELVENKKLSDCVMFLGNQGCVEELYQGMDVFLFPSRFEGMPGTMLEAQTAGLRCLMSDQITRQVILTDLVETLPLNGTAELWAKEIEKNKEYIRTSMYDKIKEKDFDIVGQSRKMESFYLNGILK